MLIGVIFGYGGVASDGLQQCLVSLLALIMSRHVGWHTFISVFGTSGWLMLLCCPRKHNTYVGVYDRLLLFYCLHPVRLEDEGDGCKLMYAMQDDHGSLCNCRWSSV